MGFPKLNLPPADLRLRPAPEGSSYAYEVFDALRRKWLCLTPEEYVRQNFCAFLIAHKGVPAGFVANEVPLKVNSTSRRSDTVVFRRNLSPLMIVEYKRPSVEITQEVFDQIARYNITFEAPFLVVTNGIVTYCVRYDLASGTYSFMDHFPDYQEMLSGGE